MDNAQVPADAELTKREAAILQLAPGIGSAAAFAILAWMMSNSELPNLVALGLAIVFVEVPISWALIFRRVSEEYAGRFSLAKAFPWTASLPVWQYLLIGVPVVIYSIIAIAVLGFVIGEPLRMTVFNWLPEWFVFNPDPRTLAASPMNVKVLISVLMILGMVLLGGITQELYSRGFLLPRIQYMGWAAPLYNALLFTVFHLVSPWSWIPFFVMILPWSYLVWWKRSVKIGIFVHVGMLAIQWVLMSLLLFGLIPAPGGP